MAGNTQEHMQLNPIERKRLTCYLAEIISETNGLSLAPTIDLLANSSRISKEDKLKFVIKDFKAKLHGSHSGNISESSLDALLAHPVCQALSDLLKSFPLPYLEEHIHLTGSLTPEFVFPFIKELLEGPDGSIYLKKIQEVYGPDVEEIKDADGIKKLLTLGPDDAFARYLEILYLPKLILTSQEVHEQAAYHMAKTLFEDHNVGSIRLKFTYSRATSNTSEQVVGLQDLTGQEVVLGLYAGFKKYKNENNSFNFLLSPCFRKELEFYDHMNYSSKEAHFNAQVTEILKLLSDHPELSDYLRNVDTVGDEKGLYRKGHFNQMRLGFRKLAYRGFEICSHHGETFSCLRKGVQAVDNAMNIWQIDTLEHGLSLGINPNIYYQTMFEEALRSNQAGLGLATDAIGREILDMPWGTNPHVLQKLQQGTPLSAGEVKTFIKTKFHHAREIEHYQHDVLNRMIQKGVKLTALPSSNKKLTDYIPGYQDHPFSWWEKKGVQLNVGTDNYVTLGTDFVKEMMILLLSEPQDLKLTKLIMVTTGEKRRPYLSNLLWNLREKLEGELAKL